MRINNDISVAENCNMLKQMQGNNWTHYAIIGIKNKLSMNIQSIYLIKLII
jgi:hypothetical protein